MNDDPAIKQAIEDSIRMAVNECVPFAHEDHSTQFHIVNTIAGMLFKRVAILTRDVAKAEDAEAQFLIRLHMWGVDPEAA
jgi:hypothetical protein